MNEDRRNRLKEAQRRKAKKSKGKTPSNKQKVFKIFLTMKSYIRSSFIRMDHFNVYLSKYKFESVSV